MKIGNVSYLRWWSQLTFCVIPILVCTSTLTLAQEGGTDGDPLADIEALGVQKEQLVLAVQQACPGPWEDLTEEVLPPENNTVPWLDTENDRTAFLTYLEESQLASSAEDREIVADDLPFVANECVAQRVRLFNGLTLQLPDSVISAVARLDQSGVFYNSAADGYEIGDIRATSRKSPARGWMFLHGQTIGSTDSPAGYRSEDLSELFELAKYWEPNSGLEDWTANDLIKLPDLRNQPDQNDSISYENVPNAVAAVAINQEIKYTKRPTSDLVFDPKPGLTELTAQMSCLAIHQQRPGYLSGVYWLDTDGSESVQPFQAYCDMENEGGGWTLVVAQFEVDPVPDWNEGIQGDYDPTLESEKGFALDTTQVPGHTETGFGKDLIAADIDYASYQYTTGDIPKTTLSGIKQGVDFHLHRSAAGYYPGHDPDAAYTTDIASWRNSLTFDKAGGASYDWAFSPNHEVSSRAGPSYGGALLLDIDGFAWTVWVR